MLLFEPFIKQKLKTIIYTNIDNIAFKCVIHDLKNIIINKLIHFYLFTYTKNINRILKETYKSPQNDPLKQMAQKYYLTHKSRKK